MSAMTESASTRTLRHLMDGLTSRYMPVPVSDTLELELDDLVWEPSKLAGHKGGFDDTILDSVPFQVFVTMLIVSNSIVIGLETDSPEWSNWDLIEHVFLLAFVVELILRIHLLGLCTFFACGRDLCWNLLDAIVVGLGVLDAIGSISFSKGSQDSNGVAPTLFRLVRVLRVLRIFKLIRFLKQLYLLAYSFAEAVQAILWVTLLMTFVLYVCSIVLVRGLGHCPEADPHSAFLSARFGNVPTSMFTLFELMSSPNLPEYAQQAGLLQAHPQLAVFLILYVIFGSFGMLALLTGVISESMFEKNQLRIEEERSERESLRRRTQEYFQTLFRRLRLNDSGQATLADVARAMPVVQRFLDANSIDYMQEELASIAVLMDRDNSGSISEEEFCHALLTITTGVRSISMLELYHHVRVISDKLEKLSVTEAGIENVVETLTAQMEELSGTMGALASRSISFVPPEDLAKNVSLQILEEVKQALPATLAEAAVPLAAHRPIDQLAVKDAVASDGAPRETRKHSQVVLEELEAVLCKRFLDAIHSHADALTKVLALEAEATLVVGSPRDGGGASRGENAAKEETYLAAAHLQAERPALAVDAPRSQRLMQDPWLALPEAPVPPDLVATETRFRIRLSEVLRANADALAKVVALEAQATFVTTLSVPESEGKTGGQR